MRPNVLSPEVKIRRPTEYRVHHHVRRQTHRLLPEPDRQPVRDYFDGLTRKLSEELCGPEPAAELVMGLFHTPCNAGFRLQSRNATLAADILRIEDDDRTAFDLGLLLCAPELGIEHAAVMHTRKLKSDLLDGFTPSSRFQGIETPDELYDLDLLACMMLNIHPRAGMFLFLAPSHVGGVEAGWRVVAPECFLTSPRDPDLAFIADEGQPLSRFVTDTFLNGVRGTTDRRAVDIVTNAHPELYARVTVMLTLKELRERA